jgi:hypothetical protein
MLRMQNVLFLLSKLEQVETCQYVAASCEAEVFLVLATISYSDQQVITKFLCQLQTSAVETLVSLNAEYGDDEKSTVCKWYNQFQNRRESPERQRE